MQAQTMPEHEFRAYHLGQPIESSGPWLPYGAWDDCVQRTTRRATARPWCSPSGATTAGRWPSAAPRWTARSSSAGRPTSPPTRKSARPSAPPPTQWQVLEVCHKPHIRLALMAELDAEGLPVVSWPGDTATDVESTAAFYQAIAEGEVAHDHDPTLAEQVSRLTAKVDRHGNPRLVEAERRGRGSGGSRCLVAGARAGRDARRPRSW